MNDIHGAQVLGMRGILVKTGVCVCVLCVACVCVLCVCTLHVCVWCVYGVCGVCMVCVCVWCVWCVCVWCVCVMCVCGVYVCACVKKAHELMYHMHNVTHNRKIQGRRREDDQPTGSKCL